jgi:hypothetical protein
MMKGKMDLLTNFILFFIPRLEMLHKKIQSLCNFSFLKIVKIESTNKVESFFSFFVKRCLQCLEFITFHIFHFTNRNGMNQNFPCRYGPI